MVHFMKKLPLITLIGFLYPPWSFITHNRIQHVKPRTSILSLSTFHIIHISTYAIFACLPHEINSQVYVDEEDEELGDDEQSHHDELLAEILAEEGREAEEMAHLEAQMKELDEMKAQQLKMKEQQQNQRKPGGMPGGSNKGFDKLEEELRRKEAAAQEMKKEANLKAREEAEKQKADKIAAQREAAFKAEVARAKDEKTRKDLERQKAKDAKIVNKILQNGNRGHHYAVLGLKCQWGEFKIGPFKLCSIKNGEIKKAYRNMARLVHPDKNRDGRAEQAFDLLEKSSSLLLDEKKRKEYDAKLKIQRKESLQIILRTIDDTWNGVTKTFNTMKRILGPFATPIFILVALII